MDDSLLKGSQIRSHRCTWEGSADHYTGRIIAAHQISSVMNIKSYCEGDREGRSQLCENCLGCAAQHFGVKALMHCSTERHVERKCGFNSALKDGTTLQSAELCE